MTVFSPMKGGDIMTPAVIAAIISGGAGIITAVIDAFRD